MSNVKNSSTEAQLIAQRREKLEQLRERTGNPYRNDFKRDALASALQERFKDSTAEELVEEGHAVTVAGRMMTQRVMGKASFAHIKDMSGAIQLYVKRDSLPDGVYSDFKKWDLGDIVGASGVMFRTQKGELSIVVDRLELIYEGLTSTAGKMAWPY